MDSSEFPKHDDNYEDVVIKSVQVSESAGGWQIDREDGFSFFVDKNSPVEPKAGMTARFYPKGIGYRVRGLFLDGREVFYRTEAEDRAKQRADLYCLTAKELIERWDSGRSIWSIELGGMGPGYEQAIQVAAVEMAREGLDVPVEGDRDKFYREGWDEVCSHALSKHDKALGGLSGAMFGAAKWLAWQWVHNGGPAALADRAREQEKESGKSRMIQVSKSFPQVAA